VESGEPGEEETGDRAAAGAEPKIVDRLGFAFQVNFSRKQLDICRAAASISGISLENWVLRTLEEAAKDTLNQPDQLPAVLKCSRGCNGPRSDR
jgi:hypothetical protein